MADGPSFFGGKPEIVGFGEGDTAAAVPVRNASGALGILATPLGSRVMRRDYGSRLFALIDAPMNRGTLVQIYAAVIEALQRWESRIVVERVTASRAAPGSITLDIRGTYLPEGRPILLDGIEVRR